MGNQASKWEKYPGAGLKKKQVREAAYRVAQRAWDRRDYGKPVGCAVVLAGPYPHDIEPLRSSLHLAPGSCWFVDTSDEGLGLVPDIWPLARTFHGDIRDLLPSLKSIALLNIDFCGHFTETVEETLELAAPHLVPGSILQYTMARGRENPSLPFRRRFLSVYYNDRARDLGVEIRVRELVGRPIRMLSCQPYRDNKMPMTTYTIEVLEGQSEKQGTEAQGGRRASFPLGEPVGGGQAQGAGYASGGITEAAGEAA